MLIKILLCTVIISTSIVYIYGQNAEISCRYIIDLSDRYVCLLSINNPNGFNNFERIGGIHLGGYTDADVQEIRNTSPDNSITTIVPSIICEQFQNIDEMRLVWLGIETIDENSVANCKNLNILNIAHRAAVIHENTFNQNGKLEKLYLINHQFTTLPETLFHNLEILTLLHIGANQIEDLPINIFKSLGNLETLDLSDNKLTTVKGEWIAHLGNLINIHLAANRITEIPPNFFAPLVNLALIDISVNDFKTIDSQSFGSEENNNLRSFLAIKNEINAIDRTFIENSKNLQTFLFESNICVDDNFKSRESAINGLSKCFKNFLNQDDCLVGDLDGRVCKLEAENAKIRAEIEDLKRRLG